MPMIPRRRCRLLLTLALFLSPCHLVTLSPCHARADDAAPILRWPEKAGSGGHPFSGGEFIALTPAPLVGDGPFSISVWVLANDLAGGDATYGRGIARS